MEQTKKGVVMQVEPGVGSRSTIRKRRGLEKEHAIKMTFFWS
jgi:hypothetical protein